MKQQPRRLTKIADVSAKEISAMLDCALTYKERFDGGCRSENLLGGKTVAMIFEKPSLRTKVAFEVATTYLGGVPIFLSSEQILASGNNQMGRESVADIARNLERFCDVILARVYSHQTIANIAANARIPVINALCDLHHPTQALADAMTLRWHFGDLRGLNVAYIGDGNNVATSLMQMCARLGAHFRFASPEGYEISEREVLVAREMAKETGAAIAVFRNPVDAVRSADVVYTDTCVSMGQETERSVRLASFDGYQVNDDLMRAASNRAVFMHCLPAHRGEEVSRSVIDGPQSVVFDQAECRMHIAKALLAYMVEAI